MPGISKIKKPSISKHLTNQYNVGGKYMLKSYIKKKRKKLGGKVKYS